MFTSGPYNAGISLRGQTTASTSPPRVARQPHTQCPARRAGERPAAAGPRQLPHRALHDRRFPRSARARSGATRAAPRPRAARQAGACGGRKVSRRQAPWRPRPPAPAPSPAPSPSLTRQAARIPATAAASTPAWSSSRRSAGAHSATPGCARIPLATTLRAPRRHVATQAGEPPLTVRCSPTAQWLGVTLRRSKLCSHAETSADAAHTWGCISPQAHNESRHLCIVHCQWGAQTRRRPERRVCVHLVHARRCGADPAPHPRAPTAHSGLQTPGLAPLNAHRSEFFMDVDRQPRPTAGRHGRTCARWCAARARRSA